MAGLVVADKLAATLISIDDLQREQKKKDSAGDSAGERARSMEDANADRIEAASERIEALAREVASEN